MKRKRSFCHLITALFLLSSLSACSKNEAATKACRGQVGEACAKCCSDNGASGHATATVNGEKKCKCLGG